MATDSDSNCTVLQVILSKFFQLIEFSSLYFIGYMKWSPLWILIPVAISILQTIIDICREMFVKEADNGEKKPFIPKTTCDDSPTWARYPNMEKTEWLNKIIRQFWQFLRNIIENRVRNCENDLYVYFRSRGLLGFYFQSINLGNKPLRTNGIVLYENVSRNEVVMDIDLSYYGNCDIKFRLVGLLGSVRNVQLIIYSLVYYIGYINWSFSWIVIPIVLSTVTKRARIINTNRRRFAKEAADGNEKKIILENIKDLPAWVHFPDTERAEWLNKIVKQFWPFINHLTRDIMKNHVEYKFRKQFEKYALGGFHFDSIILGSVPLRTGGIIVYENVSRNEVVMDIELSYTGDCDVKFRLKGLLGSMQNFQLRGKLRIILKPLIQHVPLVGGLQIFFLNNPDIDFDLDGMAGILNIPGAKAILRKCFCDTVASLMVLPNKFSIRFTKEVSTEILITPNPVGVLRVHVIRAKDLLKKDITLTGKGMSDPYAVLTVGEQTYKTGTIECTDNPKWDYWCEFVVLEHTGQELVINLWDEDNTEDEFLGRISVEIVDLMKTGQTGLCLNLQDVKHGEIHLKTTWLKLTTDYDNLKAAIYESQQLQVAHMSSALLIVFIDSATNLKQVRVSTKPNPYIQLHLGTQLKHTNTVKRSINPVWEEGFIFLVGNPESDFLNLKMIDSKTEAELYAINYNISLLFNKKNLEVEKDVVTLESGRNDCKLVWSLHLKVFHNENFQEYMKQYPAPVASSDKTLERLDSDSFSNESSEHENDIFDKSTDSLGSFMISGGSSVASRFFGRNLGEINLTLRYSLQRQRLIVVIHRIDNLFHGESHEEKDIYVKLYLLPERSKATKRKSKVIKLFGDPIFDERFEFLIPQDGLNSKSLEISVIEEKMIKNEIIGQVTLSMGEINFPHTGSFDLSARDE